MPNASWVVLAVKTSSERVAFTTVYRWLRTKQRGPYAFGLLLFGGVTWRVMSLGWPSFLGDRGCLRACSSILPWRPVFGGLVCDGCGWRRMLHLVCAAGPRRWCARLRLGIKGEHRHRLRLRGRRTPVVDPWGGRRNPWLVWVALHTPRHSNRSALWRHLLPLFGLYAVVASSPRSMLAQR